jgi:heme exporter protein C
MPTPRTPAASGTGSPATRLLGLATLAGLVLLAAFALWWSPADRVQQDSVRLMYVHVPTAILAFAACGLTTVSSAMWLRRRSEGWWVLGGASAEVGVVYTALTLVTGSIWGRPTWGTWWVWDARLTLSALMLALYLGYLALRRVPADEDTRARRSAVAALLAVLVVPVNHFAVEWWRTLHQGRSLSQLDPGRDLDGIFIGAMFLGFLAMTLTYAWFVLTRLRTLRLEAELEDVALDVALAERRAEAVEALT